MNGMHSRRQNTLYIVRGLPGSGKSTIAKKLVSSNNHFEADMVFMTTGVYVFDHTKLREAHKWCYNQTLLVMKRNMSDVAVSNTFTQKWEYEKYVDLAKELGYSVQIIECHGDFGNVHGVPQNVIDNMKKRWEPTK